VLLILPSASERGKEVTVLLILFRSFQCGNIALAIYLLYVVEDQLLGLAVFTGYAVLLPSQY
jgi:hypothetical protein